MDKKSSRPQTVQHGLMSLYFETDTTPTVLNPETAPIYTGLKPTETEFKNESLIARGGMKTIFKIFNPKTARFVALARLNPDSPEELYEPFLREARLTAQLDHPNIIKVYDIGLNADSTPYFIMELKPGQSLTRIIDQSSNAWKKGQGIDTIPKLLNIFLKVCDAIDYAHSQNVLHLDLKPDNIQIGHYGEVVVCDWGLGKLLGDPTYDGGDFDRLLLNPDLLNNMTLSGHIKGTPGYMAPEQAATNGIKNFQTDIYSLGAILYSMLTNTLPVDGETADELLENTVQGRIVGPKDRCPEKSIPQAISSIARKAMALNPKHRYGSVGAMRHDLVSYLNGFSTSAENAGFFREIRLFYLRQKKILNISGVFVLIIILSTAVAFHSIHKSRMDAVNARDALQHEKEERLKVGKDAAPEHYKKAVSSLSIGRMNWAESSLETAVALDPTNPEYHNLLASLYFLRGQHEAAHRMFWEFPQSFYKLIQNFNHGLLSKDLSTEEELDYVEQILDGCRRTKPTPLTTAIMSQWALDEREEYRQLALKNFNLQKDMCTAVLTYAERKRGTDAAQDLMVLVLRKLQEEPEWTGRRIPATIGLALSSDPIIREAFKALIPKNLVLGQPITTLGGYSTNPEYAIDGDQETYWAAAPLPAEINIDLGDVHILSKAKIITNDFAKNAKTFRYDVLVSTRQGDYIRVASRNQKSHANQTVDHYEFAPIAARYVRLKIIYLTGKTPIQIREVEIY